MGLLSNWLLRREFGGCHIKNAQRCWNKVQNQNRVALGVRGGWPSLVLMDCNMKSRESWKPFFFFWTDYTSEARVWLFAAARRILGKQKEDAQKVGEDAMKGLLHRLADMSLHMQWVRGCDLGVWLPILHHEKNNGFLQVSRARSVRGHFCARASKLL